MAELKPIPFFYGSFYVIEETPTERAIDAWNKRS